MAWTLVVDHPHHSVLQTSSVRVERDGGENKLCVPSTGSILLMRSAVIINGIGWYLYMCEYLSTIQNHMT